MNDYYLEYWIEAVDACLSDNKITLDPDLIRVIAKDMMNASDMQDQAFGQPSTGDYSQGIVSQLEKELEAERKKSVCSRCNGAGMTNLIGGTLIGTSVCPKCKGRGIS